MKRALPTLALAALLFSPLAARAQDAGVPAPPAVPTVPAGTPRYLPAIEHELDVLGVEASCHADSPTIGRCEWHAHGAATREDFDLHLTYSDDTDTIYFYVANLAHAPQDAPQTQAVLRRLMELNWELLSTKLEWNAADGEVRVALVLHTDSNFDRRAFRSILRALVVSADRLAGELRALAAGAANP